MFGLFKSETTKTLKVVGGYYFSNNIKALKRPLNPDFKNKAIGGVVYKYLDVVAIATISKDFKVCVNGKPIGYVHDNDKPFISKIYKHIVKCEVGICGGICRIDDVSRDDVIPDMQITITYRD